MHDGSDEDESGIFYVYPQHGDDNGKAIFDKSKKIAAKYLVFDGAFVVDSVAGGSNKVGLYETLNPDGTIDQNSRFHNTKNYLIVPADYDPAEAGALAKKINFMGPVSAISYTIKSFVPRGVQDLQRTGSWGVPAGETAPAFKGAASWNLGFVTEQTYIPDVFAEIGGGMLNVGEYIKAKLERKQHTFPVGPFGMDADDARDFQAGVEAAWLHDDQELASIHENAIAIGSSVHNSIAPIGRSPGRAGGPGAPATHSGNDDFLVLDHFCLEPDLAAVTAPHAPPDLFHQIGDPTLKNAWLSREITGSLMPDAEFSIMDGQLKDIDKLGQSVALYIGHVDGALAAHSPVGRVLTGASQHRPYMQNDELPSMAPIKMRQHKAQLHQNATPRRQYGETHDDTAKHTTAPHDAKHVLSQTQVKRTLEALLNAQARMPPSGPTGFDPSLTPAWAGLKIPM